MALRRCGLTASVLNSAAVMKGMGTSVHTTLIILNSWVSGGDEGDKPLTLKRPGRHVFVIIPCHYSTTVMQMPGRKCL